MQVILLERIQTLGMIGQMVNVKPGYARNFLLPKKKALRATKANMAFFEAQKSQIEADNLKRKQDAEYVSEKIKDLNLQIVRQASETGHLYGSIRNKDIVAAIKEKGFTITKDQVSMPTAVKELGVSIVNIVLHPEVIVPIKLHVAKSFESEIKQEEMQGEIVEP